MKSLSAKLWTLIVIFIVVTIAFMYVLTDFLYERLYVADSESAMIEVASKLQTKYRGGEVTDDFVSLVEEYNNYSNYNVFAVRNPRELSACVPFEIDYDALIGIEARKQLLAGEPYTKIGYEERFGRDVISVVLPLVDENRLEGILYVYSPLAKISELAKQEIVLLVAAAIIFTVIAAVGGLFGLRRILKPLQQLQSAVKQMTAGNYDTRVKVSSQDEIGQLSQAFNQMAASIQQEDESQKAFLATVSHELRTPISYVKGYSESIEQHLLSEQEERDAIRLIAREAGRMERLTNDILQLARKEPLEPANFVPIVLAECIREVVQLMQFAIQQKSIQLMLHLDEDIIVEGDESQLKQVFINVLQNAITYSESESTITISCCQQLENARIVISDTGIGIPAEDVLKVTARFYRVNKARSRADGGSGLGLSIVEKIIKEHNGSVQIESELGVGTTVTLHLPIVEGM